jgi:hypothetical protein
MNQFDHDLNHQSYDARHNPLLYCRGQEAISAGSLQERVPLLNYKLVSPKGCNRTLDNASSLTIKRNSPSYYQERETKRDRNGVEVMDLIIETLSQDSMQRRYQQRDPSIQTEYQFPVQ